jgi:O-antigen/teichoic acid export membrane protein
MKPASLVKSGLWISLATFSARIFAFLSSLALARLLTPSEFGVIGITYVFWGFFCLFVQDISGGFINYKGVEPRYVNTALTVSLITGLIFAVAMVVTSPLVANFFNEPALIGLLCIFAFNVFLSSAYYVFAGVMTRKTYYRALANISFISSVTRLLFTIGAALLSCSYWSFAIGDTAFWIIGCILTWRYSHQPFRIQLDSKVRDEVVTFYMGAVGSSFGYYMNANLDNFTVGKLLGNASLGFYNLAYQLTMATFTVFHSVSNQLGTPTFAQLKDDKEQESVLLTVLQRTAVFTAPLYGLIFLMFDPQIVTFVFGTPWLPICSVMPGLLVSAYFRVVNLPLGSMLAAKGRPDVNARVNIQIAPIAIAGFVAGAYWGGIVGVSIAVALVLGVGWTFYWWWMGCRHLRWPLGKFLVSCFLPALLTAPGLLAAFYLPLILKPLAFLLVYLVTLRILTPKLFFQIQVLMSQFWGRLVKLKP